VIKTPIEIEEVLLFRLGMDNPSVTGTAGSSIPSRESRNGNEQCLKKTMNRRSLRYEIDTNPTKKRPFEGLQ